jgi:hypothetical protein
MQMPSHVVSYSGGMNKDASVNNYPNTCYFDSQNFRLITDDSTGLTSGSLVTPKGNSVSFTLPTNMVMLGHAVLRDCLIVLAHDSTNGTDPDRIYRIDISKLKTAGNLTINDNYYHIDIVNNYLIYKEDLGFDTNYKIRIVGNYENDDIQKIYFVDGLNTLKHLNIIYNATYNDLTTLDPQLLEILPNHTYGSYTITEDTGGNLKAGRIQYSYQLYSISGAETLFAPPSNSYNVVTYNSVDGKEFSGNELETFVNKALTVTITLGSGIEDTFNRIRLVALSYEVYGDVPTVRIVSEQDLVSNIVIFTDIGNTIGELVLEEFQVIKNDFIPKTIESKNNYLFAGNITEEYFDVDELVHELAPATTFFDSRAYRWRYIAPLTVECVINKGMANELTIDSGAGPDYTLVDEDNDCINTYNNIINDTNATRDHVFKYKKITTTPTVADLGGTGRIISYGFTTTTLPAGAYSNVSEIYLDIPSSTYPGYTSPTNIFNYVGYQDDEVYRCGIVLYDLKGRPSYPKWIADIRMPNMGEELYAGVYSHIYEMCVVDGGTPYGYMNAKALGISFTIDWDNINTDYPGLLSQLSGYQIVRMQRTDNDSTIKAQGLIVPTHVATAVGYIKGTNYSTYNITSAKDYSDNTITQIVDITGTSSTMDKTLVELLSPEIAINKNIILDRTNDFLEVCGYMTNIALANAYTATLKSYSVLGQTITSYEPTPTLKAAWRKSITDGFISVPETKSPTSHVVDATTYTARGYDDSTSASNPEMSYKGTSFVAKISSAFSNVSPGGSSGTEEAMYGRYRRYMGYSIYGGATYSERSYNSYIKAGEFTQVSSSGTTTINVYGGDTYIGPFIFLKLFIDILAEYATYSGQASVTFPVRSKINTYFRLDKIAKYLHELGGSDYHLAEYQSIGVSQYPNNYPEVGDLYRYNSAYSAENISKVFSAKPFDFRSTEQNDVMVISSEKKFNGEYSDSWLKFKYNNYIELEGEQGPVTRLINNNDKIVAFQSRGISVLSVLERELVETQNTSSLTIGVGGILSRYDYISKVNGSSLYDAITTTDAGIYFYDDYNHGIYRIGDGLESLSDTKGMKSYYESTPYTSLITTYNKRNREVYFSPSTTNTLSFSGYTNTFEGFFTFKVGASYVNRYITFDKYLLSSLDANKFYLHDVGNYNEYYGEHQTSSLTLIANPNKTSPVSFHIINWLTDLTTAGADVLNLTFDTLRISNTHQDTGVITLLGNTDLMRRFRTWRLNVFRNLSDSKRIRDSYIKAIFTWTQDSNHRKLVVHPVSFNVLPTKIT